MFAFAIWDETEQELFVARDRFGIKPLYYGEHNGRWLFGSEVKALLAVGHPAALDPVALGEYFTFQNVFSDRTLFEGVRLLPPGHAMRVNERGVSVRQYWDLHLEPDATLSDAEWVEQIRHTFEAGVSRQLVSDVRLGSYLSGRN